MWQQIGTWYVTNRLTIWCALRIGQLTVILVFTLLVVVVFIIFAFVSTISLPFIIASADTISDFFSRLGQLLASVVADILELVRSVALSVIITCKRITSTLQSGIFPLSLIPAVIALIFQSVKDQFYLPKWLFFVAQILANLALETIAPTTINEVTRDWKSLRSLFVLAYIIAAWATIIGGAACSLVFHTPAFPEISLTKTGWFWNKVTLATVDPSYLTAPKVSALGQKLTSFFEIAYKTVLTLLSTVALIVYTDNIEQFTEEEGRIAPPNPSFQQAQKGKGEGPKEKKSQQQRRNTFRN